MFLCLECHDRSNCPHGGYEGRSGGRCEMCGAGGSCLDCHGYDFSKNAGPAPTGFQKKKPAIKQRKYRVGDPVVRKQE